MAGAEAETALGSGLPFSPVERESLLRVRLLGPKMVQYLELIGVSPLAELVRSDAIEPQLRFNAALGRRYVDKMGLRALENAITAARGSADRDG